MFFFLTQIIFFAANLQINIPDDLEFDSVISNVCSTLHLTGKFYNCIQDFLDDDDKIYFTKRKNSH